MMNSQGDEIGILDVLEIKSFAAHRDGQPFKNYLKIIFVDFTLWWWYHLNVFVKSKTVKVI